MEADKFILSLCTDNDLRQATEEKYKNMNPADKLELLLEALCYGKADNIVETADVRLRQFFSTEFMASCKGVMDAPHVMFLQELLRPIRSPIKPTARKIICKVIAEVSEKLVGPDGQHQWTQLPGFLLSCASSKQAHLQSAALDIFAAAPAIFATEEMQKLSLINQLFSASLDPTADMAVRQQAVHAIGVFIQSDGEVEQTVLFKEFRHLLPQILVTIGESLKARTDVSFLVWLKDIACTSPQFLRPRLDVVFDLCNETLRSQDAEDIWHQLALEVIVALSETLSATVRKRAARSIADLMPYLLEMLKDLEDDVNWDQFDAVGEGRNHTTAKRSLDSLASSLGGAVILPLVMQALPNMMSHTAWQQRYAGLTAMSAIGEGCRKEMQPMLHNIVWSLEASLYDSHPRVRYAACSTVGQLARDFVPRFARKFHQPILSGLLSLLQDSGNPRLQAHVSAVLGSFCEDCPEKILVRYLENIMPSLMSEFKYRINQISAQGSVMILENVILTVTCVAKTTKQDFVLYYDYFIPALMSIMKDATSKALSKLRGRTIECITFIGLAVGPAKFMADAGEVMNILLNSQAEGELRNDERFTPFLFAAWSRLCEILGQQFNSYLSLIMEPIMSKAAIRPSAVYSDIEKVEDIKSGANWTLFDFDRHTQLLICTSELEQKVAATSLLFYFSRATEIDLTDYVDEMVHIMLSCLNFVFHPEVRSAAAESLPYLLYCAATKGRDHLRRLWLYICPELLKVFRAELLIDVQSQILDSLEKCIDCVGCDFVFKHNLQEVLEILICYLTEHLRRSDKRLQVRNGEDHDEFAEKELLEREATDSYLLGKVADIIHAFFVNIKTEFLPHFSQMLPFFNQIVDIRRHWLDRLGILAVYLGMIESCGPACVPYKQVFTQSFLVNLGAKEPEMQLVAVSGCAALAQYGGESFAVTCALATAPLLQIINAPKSREPASIKVIENAIDAITKILRYNNSRVPNIDQILKGWCTWLGVIEDRKIATHAYSHLCDLVYERHPLILANLLQAVAAIADAFVAGVIQPAEELGKRMLNVVEEAKIQPGVGPRLAAILTCEQIDALETYQRLVNGAGQLKPEGSNQNTKYY